MAFSAVVSLIEPFAASTAKRAHASSSPFPAASSNIGVAGSMLSDGVPAVGVAASDASWTTTGFHPPGACVTFAPSQPSRRGMEGPVRSRSRMPTL